jgi:hypothetical protein
MTGYFLGLFRPSEVKTEASFCYVRFEVFTAVTMKNGVF